MDGRTDQVRHTRKRRIAVGVVAREGYRRVVIEFDDELFAEIRGMAERQNCSFGEAVRLLATWGLQAEEETWFDD